MATKALPLGQRLPKDAVAGFLVFLIALPLCLGIAKASGYPPIGGVITAIIGGVITSLISNSELTIKGPAAGMIAIVAGCVTAFGGTFGKDPVADLAAYKMALGVGVAAAVLQILFGLFKAGKLGDFFPTAVVHGLLASIGVIIMIKSGLAMLGVTATLPKENTHLIMQYPKFIMLYNLPVTMIGLVSLALMIVYPLLKTRVTKVIPVQVVVLLVAVPLAIGMGLRQPSSQENADAKASARTSPAATAPARVAAISGADAEKAEGAHAALAPETIDPRHAVAMAGKPWSLDPKKYLINVPLDFTQAFVLPDFAPFKQWRIALQWALNFGRPTESGGQSINWAAFEQLRTALVWVVMFSIISSLESLLSAKAVDILDPQKRKTDLNRDLFGCGVANLVSSSIGGLPMISEIVRSRFNVDNGAQSRLANMFHGLCLLLFVSLLPFVVNMIPVAALMAMLVFTGFRLAHPREFMHMYNIGLEQFVVFVTTIAAIVCTDLLVGSLIGLAVELVINVLNGLPFASIFSCATQVQEYDGGYLLRPQRAAVFSNWLTLRSKIEQLGLGQKKNIVVDLSKTRLVDHTVMEKLHEMEREFREANLALKVVGLDKHAAFSPHPAAARKLPDHAMAA